MSDPIGHFFKALFNRKMPSQKQERDEPTVGPDAAGGAATLTVEPDVPFAPRSYTLSGEDREHGSHTSWSAAMVKTNFLLVSNVGLVLLLMMSLWSQLNQKPTVVIKPPVLTGEIRIEDGLPNKEWQESWALYLAHMIGNINPRNVEFVSKQVVAMLSTNLQLEKERDIRRIVDMMRMSNLTQSFEVQDLKYEASTRMVWVWGYKTTQLASSNKQATSATEDSADRRRWTFEFIIRLNELGMPVVTHIDQYDGLPRFDRANGVTEEGMVIEPPKKSSSKVQQAKPTKEQH